MPLNLEGLLVSPFRAKRWLPPLLLVRSSPAKWSASFQTAVGRLFATDQSASVLAPRVPLLVWAELVISHPDYFVCIIILRRRGWNLSTWSSLSVPRNILSVHFPPYLYDHHFDRITRVVVCYVQYGNTLIRVSTYAFFLPAIQTHGARQ